MWPMLLNIGKLPISTYVSLLMLIKTFSHLPYSSDLVGIEHYLFWTLKNYLDKNIFCDNRDLVYNLAKVFH